MVATYRHIRTDQGPGKLPFCLIYQYIIGSGSDKCLAVKDVGMTVLETSGVYVREIHVIACNNNKKNYGGI